jgi:uncharacterized membrane protein YjjP (DUF1212 family)
MQQQERRLEEAIRERTRLQTLNMNLIRDISEMERERVSTASEIRQKAEREIHDYEQKVDRELDKLKKEQHRYDNLLRSNEMGILNLERELDSIRHNSARDEKH